MSNEQESAPSFTPPSELVKQSLITGVESLAYVVLGVMLTFVAFSIYGSFDIGIEATVIGVASIMDRPSFPTFLAASFIAWVAYMTTYRITPGRSIPESDNPEPEYADAIWYQTLGVSALATYETAVIGIGSVGGVVLSEFHPALGALAAVGLPAADHLVFSRNGWPTPGFVISLFIIIVAFWPLAVTQYVLAFIGVMARIPARLFSIETFEAAVRFETPTLVDQVVSGWRRSA